MKQNFTDPLTTVLRLNLSASTFAETNNAHDLFPQNSIFKNLLASSCIIFALFVSSIAKKI